MTLPCLSSPGLGVPTPRTLRRVGKVPSHGMCSLSIPRSLVIYSWSVIPRTLVSRIFARVCEISAGGPSGFSVSGRSIVRIGRMGSVRAGVGIEFSAAGVMVGPVGMLADGIA
jgi:hypothetical protein